MDLYDVFNQNNKKLKKIPCPDGCDHGYFYSWEDPKGEICPDCVGTGRDLNEDCWATPCIYCNGSGRISKPCRKRCQMCNGSGWVFG